MPKVAQVNLPFNVRTLWFDPQGLDIQAGDSVVVKTKRGTELGRAASGVIDVSEKKISELKSPLQPVLRVATEEDMEQAAEMERLSQEALPVFKELARETSEDMHPVSVEYLLDGDKAVFYFESEDRIDFRELVRQLASRFHVRVDMRQIGVRDEARIVGGLAHCGQEVCCKRLGGEFNPVSIRMAKDQDLSLNPQKVSGLCGRLMCCLRYENEAYKEFKSRAPKMGATIETPDGPAKVTEYDVPRETVSLAVEGEKPVKVPLSDFEPAEDGKRPSEVGPEAWEEAQLANAPDLGGIVAYQLNQFTGNDKLGDARAVHHETRERQEKPPSDRSGGRRKRRAHAAQKESEQFSSKTDTSRKPRRRKSTTITGGASDGSADKGSSKKQQSDKNAKPKQSKAKGQRPGQKSSGLSRGNNDFSRSGKSESGKGTNAQNSGDSKRRRRRRRKPKQSDAGAASADGSSAN